MKKITFVLWSFLLVSIICQGQEVKTVQGKNGLYGTGLYNHGKFVIEPIYDGIYQDLGSYRGNHFYAFREVGGNYAIFDSEGKRLTDFDIRMFPNYSKMDLREGLCICVKGSRYGIYSLDPFYEIIPFSYSNITMDLGANVFVQTNSGEKKYSMQDLKNQREKFVLEKKEKEEKERQDKLRAEAAAKKEKELASFTTYAKAYVEPKINEWQQKGEFEKLADYQNRVTGPNRSSMIETLSAEAEAKFIEENAAQHYEQRPMTIDQYDSENEVFAIKTEKFGTLLLNVPIDKASTFKQRFPNLKRENPEYFIDKDAIALRSITFRDPSSGEKIVYNNGAALNYQQYDINPETFEFDVVQIASSGRSGGETVTTTAKTEVRPPVVRILSPEKGASYNTPTVVIRYQASTFDGSTPQITIWINDDQAEEVPIQRSGNAKGAVAAWAEKEIKMPTLKTGESAIVLVQAFDGQGIPSEVQRVTLRYAGQSRKGDLWLFAVGINDYKAPLPRLTQAVQDAEKFVSTVEGMDLSMYGEVHKLIIPEQEATTRNLLDQLATLSRTVREDDVVMAFFSGHGVSQRDRGFFMTKDAEPESPFTGIPKEALNTYWDDMVDKGCHVVVFIDACHAGMMGSKGYATPLDLANKQIFGFYSSQGSETSREDEKEGGYFTSALLKGLSGAAANTDGEVTTRLLRNYIEQDVKERSGGKQNPVFNLSPEEITLFKIKK